jgi:hypothetical protein
LFISVLGAPAANYSISSIQNVTTDGIAVAPTKQIQIISTSIIPQPAIMKFYSTASNNSAISGFFVVSYGEYGPTRPIPADANADMIEATFSYG